MRFPGHSDNSTNSNMMASKHVLTASGEKLVVPGSFDIPPEEHLNLCAEWVKFLRDGSIQREILSQFGLTEKLSKRYVVPKSRVSDGDGVAEKVHVSNMFLDFDLSKDKQVMKKFEKQRTKELTKTPPIGTVLEVLSEEYGVGTIGVCLGAVPGESGDAGVQNSNRLRVLIFPAWYKSHAQEVIEAPLNNFKRAGAYTVEEKAAFMCVIYTAMKDVISDYERAIEHTLMDGELKRLEVMKTKTTKAIWFSKVGTERKPLNFQIRMPGLCVPDPVRVLICRRVSRMLNEIYPDDGTPPKDVPSWCVSALRGIFHLDTSSTPRAKKSMADTIREMCKKGDSTGPLNPDLSAKGLRLGGSLKKSDRRGTYASTDVFFHLQHENQTCWPGVHKLLRERISNGQLIVKEAKYIDVEELKGWMCQINLESKDKKYASVNHRAVANMVDNFIRFGGNAFSMKERGKPSTVSSIDETTMAYSVIRSDIAWNKMMYDLCDDPGVAARVVREWSIFPTPLQIAIATACSYSPDMEKIIASSSDKGKSTTRVWENARDAFGFEPRVVKEYVEKFEPSGWKGPPVPYMDATIKNVYRSKGRTDRFTVNLDSTFCCRKKAAEPNQDHDGYHSSSTVSLIFRSDGVIHATCFSQNGPCALDKRRDHVQESSWDEKDRAALGFSDFSYRAEPMSRIPTLKINSKRKPQMNHRGPSPKRNRTHAKVH